MSFVSNCVTVSWFVVLALSILDSISLLAFRYREPSHESYALVLLAMMVAFAIGSIFSPVSFGLVKASTGAVSSFFLSFSCCPSYSVRLLVGLQEPQSRKFHHEKALCFSFYRGLSRCTDCNDFISTVRQQNKCYFPANNHTADNAHFMNDQAPRYQVC